MQAELIGLPAHHHVRARRVRVQPVVALRAARRGEPHQPRRLRRVGGGVVDQRRAGAQLAARRRRRRRRRRGRRRGGRGGRGGRRGRARAALAALEQQVAHLLAVDLGHAEAQREPRGARLGARAQQRAVPSGRPQRVSSGLSGGLLLLVRAPEASTPQEERQQPQYRVSLARARLPVRHQRGAPALRHLGRQSLCTRRDARGCSGACLARVRWRGRARAGERACSCSSKSSAVLASPPKTRSNSNERAVPPPPLPPCTTSRVGGLPGASGGARPAAGPSSVGRSGRSRAYTRMQPLICEGPAARG